MLDCSKCKRDSELSGNVTGHWTCGSCVDRQQAKDRARAIQRTKEAREAFDRGDRQAILVPGKRLPPETTDDNAQAFADEHYGIEWERRPNEIIIWCEM